MKRQLAMKHIGLVPTFTIGCVPLIVMVHVYCLHVYAVVVLPCLPAEPLPHHK